MPSTPICDDNAGTGLSPCPLGRAAALVFMLLMLSCTQVPEKETVSAADGTGRAANPELEVETVAVVAKSIPLELRVTGTLYPHEEVTVSAQVEETVARIHADLGDFVRRGQPLVSLDAEELRLEFERDRAALGRALAQLGVEGEQDYRSVDEQEVAEVKQARAKLNEAELQLQRALALHKRKVLSDSDLLVARTNHEVARSNYEVSLKRVRELKASIKQLEAALALTEKKLRDSVIRAPIDGYVKERRVAPGEYVRANDPVMILVDNDPLKFRCEVPERYLARLSVGLKVDLTLDSYPGRSFSGRITRLSPSVSEQTRGLQLEAQIDNPQGRLKSGTFAAGSLKIGQREVILIPEKAVLEYGGRKKIFAVIGGRVEERSVILGEQHGDLIEVEQGARAGEQVAVSNLMRLRDGMKIKKARS